MEDPAATQEKYRDRMIQTGLEYWRTQYDYLKQLMTIDILATAGFVALLGGFFSGDDPWGIAHFLDWLVSGKDGNEIALGNNIAAVIIALIFAGFYISIVFAFRAADRARYMIGRVHKIQSPEHIYNTTDYIKAEQFEKNAASAKWLLYIALALLILFITSNLLLYEWLTS